MQKQIADQQKLQAYMIPISSNDKKIGIKKNTYPATHTKNQSLPSISFAKQQKVNVLRNEVDEANHQILMLRARLNTLKIQKQRNEKKKQRNRQQISFIHTVRERMFQEKQLQQKNNEKREQELNRMKNQANQLREQLIKNRELSKSIIREKKFENAQEERQRRRNDESFLKRLKSQQKSENQLKAYNVKRDESEIQSKMREFKQSRISFASNNHREKIKKSMTEKEKAEKTLQKLRRKERRFIEDYRKSEAQMESSLQELEGLNPEKKHKGSISSRSPQNTHI